MKSFIMPSSKLEHLFHVARLLKGHRACLSPSLYGSFSVANIDLFVNLCLLRFKIDTYK